jgi:hypothetical protein
MIPIIKTAKLFTTIAITGVAVASIFSITSSSSLAQSQSQTWNQFVQSGESDYIQMDYDLPDEFRNGFVYFNYGANQITAFILKKGLAAPRNSSNTSTPNEIDYDVADHYVRAGQAIVLNWNLGNSGLEYLDDPTVRFPRKETGCLRVTCLTATFLNEAEIAKILRSERVLDRPEVTP